MDVASTHDISDRIAEEDGFDDDDNDEYEDDDEGEHPW